MGRNDAVQSITGTRNVFVDYPEYAYLLFGREVPESLVTPSGEAQRVVIPDDNEDNTTDDTIVTEDVTTVVSEDGTTEKQKESGCGASVSVASVVIIGIIPFIVKKREED